ncbi:MAG: hypothetical protein ACKO6D_12630 [Rubrivivax sp.]
MKTASGMATRCCGTPDAAASHSVFFSDFQNHSSCSAKLKFSSPTKCMAPRPLVGSQDWKARYREKTSGNTPNTAKRIRKGLTKT